MFLHGLRGDCLQKTAAAFRNVPPGGRKITRVPRVGHVAGAGGVVEQTVDFARRMGFKKIGIATCAGLLRESRALARVLRANGFEVYSVACKAGMADKSLVGIDEDCKAVGANMCNPILQAKHLNRVGTDLNILVGLCVGHDSMFYKYAEGLTTTLVAKDRVTGHNPAAPLYQLDGYYKRLLTPAGEG